MENAVINEKLIYLKDLLRKLKIRLDEYAKEKDEEKKETLFAAITKFSEEIIETAIKINNKLLEEKKDFASTYSQTFTKLKKYYKFKKSDIEILAKTTSIRNKATHEYDVLFSNMDLAIEKYKELLIEYPKYLVDIKEIVRDNSLETRD